MPSAGGLKNTGWTVTESHATAHLPVGRAANDSGKWRRQTIEEDVQLRDKNNKFKRDVKHGIVCPKGKK